MAAKNGQLEVVNMLMIAGINTMKINNHGETALDVSKDQDTFNILRKCEIITDLRRQVGAMQGYKERKQPVERKVRRRIKMKEYEPVTFTYTYIIVLSIL